ncbi:formate C-acetyltransferase [Candidatus Moduliflexus flocculans]|uniref:Formate C-acetyltransferase n=1 Tax=Candidatus Moduliflexus flocculans TaxID=1499966 RepID=A0A0S6VPN4_9BACT|nr:formate C-acetyltransferase [Candidatus Moduliflexus flocculans]
MTNTPTLYDLQANPGLAFPPEDWKTTRPIERIARMKTNLLRPARQIDLERARYTTASYQATEGQPMPLRRARMLLDLARQTSIAIGADKLIVGNRSLLPRMGVIAPEGAVDWVDRELDILATRPQDKFTIRPEEIQELRERIFPYWRGKTLEDTVAKRVPDDIMVAVKGKAFSLNQTDHAQGHILPDVEGWLRLGPSGLRAKVEAAKQRRPERQVFYDAALIALQAAQELMRRYAELAHQLSTQTDDAARSAELIRVADVCDWISEQPPRDFREALQAMWFLFVLLQMESNASSFSPGRFDQYMLPFLARDLERGALTLPEAQILLEYFWLKFNEIVLLRSSSSARYFAGFPIGFNLVVGGQLANGRDATNFLSYMCLRAQADVGLTQPNLSIRIHNGSPQEFLTAAAQVISQGSGMPQVFNDEVIIPGQINRGIAPEDALNYAVVGCVELSTPGKALGWSDASMFNMTRVLELTLFGGKDPQTGTQIGLPTPPLDAMADLDELEAAYDAQLAHFVPLMVKGCNIVDSIHAETLPSPFLSLVIEDCVERGVDVTAGGAHYNFSGVQGVQVANVADSLAVIRQAVFEEHWVGSQELLAILRNNFAQQETLRQRLIHRVPKFGNDDDRVDRYAQKWANRFSELVAQHPTIRGGVYQPGFYTVSAHVPMGSHVGATPDGRLAGTPLADGGLSPTAGRDAKGPTAALRSVGKLDLKLASNGTLLNMKFLPSFFDGREALKKFVTLLRGFCQLNIPHVQFNVVSAETLRQAQANPEEFRHLVVRVAGYSAYFTELDHELQEEIIRRTEFGTI